MLNPGSSHRAQEKRNMDSQLLHRTHSGAHNTRGIGSFSKGLTKKEWERPDGPLKSFSPDRIASHCWGKDTKPVVLRTVVKIY